MPTMINLGSDISCQREQKPSSLGLCRVQPKSDDSHMLRINPKDYKRQQLGCSRQISYNHANRKQRKHIRAVQGKDDLGVTAESRLFTYHKSNSDVRESLSDELIQQVRTKLCQYISPVDGQTLKWRDVNGHRHFDFMYRGVKHSLYYTFDDHIIMGVYLDGQIVNTEVFDYDNSQKEMELFAEMWLLQYIKDLYSEQ